MTTVMSSVNQILPDNSCMDWIAPALLIMDAMSQPILVDKINVDSAISELGKVESMSLEDSESASPLSPDLTKLLHTQFGVKELNPKKIESIFDDSCVEQSSGDKSNLKFQFPLYTDNGLTTEQSIQALHLIVSLIRTLDPKFKRSHSIFLAAMQLIVHLTRDAQVQYPLMIYEVFFL